MTIAASAPAAPAPSAPEIVSSYRISLRATGERLDVDGSASFPALKDAGSAWDFYLSALIEAPHFTLTCGTRNLPVAAVSSVLEGGDRKWTLRTLRPCAGGRVLRLGFRYAAERIDAPQMRLTNSFGFAGGGGELWYPQRSFAERQTATIDMDVPARFLAIATGRLTRAARSGERRRFRYVAASPAKLAFAYGPYAEAWTGPARVVSSISRDAAAGWGNSVRATSGTPGATLLTEGLAQYGAIVAVEAVQGPAAGRALRLGTLPGNPTSSVSTYRSLLQAGQDRAPAAFLPQNQDEVLLAHRLATSKGALVLRYFASLVGERQFHSMLRSFLATKRGGRTSWAELEDWIHAHSRGAYRWFFEQWLHRPGAPELTVSYCVEAKRVTGEVKQSGTIYQLALPLEIRGPWGSRRVTVAASQARTAFGFDVAGPVETLVPDPDAFVPTAAATSVVRSCG